MKKKEDTIVMKEKKKQISKKKTSRIFIHYLLPSILSSDIKKVKMVKQ